MFAHWLTLAVMLLGWPPPPSGNPRPPLTPQIWHPQWDDPRGTRKELGNSGHVADPLGNLSEWPPLLLGGGSIGSLGWVSEIRNEKVPKEQAGSLGTAAWGCAVAHRHMLLLLPVRAPQRAAREVQEGGQVGCRPLWELTSVSAQS